jgi:hypothetical protein
MPTIVCRSYDKNARIIDGYLYADTACRLAAQLL